MTAAAAPQPVTGHPAIGLTVLVIAASLTGIGLSIMTVGYPALGEAFPGVSDPTLSWVTNIFTIVGAATLVPAGVLADKLGRRRMLLVGTLLFLAGSVLGGLAPSVGVLIGARAVLALGASAVNTAAVALLLATMPANRLPLAIGIWAVAGGTSSAIGPPVGGLAIEWLGWEWMFWLNVPFCLVVLVVVPLVYRESRSADIRALPDPLGGLMVAAATALVTLGIVQSDPWGWADWKVGGSIVGGLAVFGLFVQRTWNHPNPLVELRLFRFPNVRRSNLSMLIFASSWFAMFFGFTVIIIRSWGWTPIEGGFAVAPLALFAGVVGVLIGRIAHRTGHRMFILPGTAIYVGGTIMLWVVLGDEPNAAVFVTGMTIIGVATGMVFPSLMAASVTDVPAEKHSLATGINFTAQRVATTIGVALGLTFATTAASASEAIDLLMGMVVVTAALSLPFSLRIDTRPRQAQG